MYLIEKYLTKRRKLLPALPHFFAPLSEKLLSLPSGCLIIYAVFRGNEETVLCCMRRWRKLRQQNDESVLFLGLVRSEFVSY